jgi:hypothetical protein
MGRSGPRTLVDVLYEDILPRLSVEDAYPDVAFTHNRGRYWRAGCPIHGGEDSNFTVDTQTLSWTCFFHCGHGSYLGFLNGGLARRGSRFLELVEILAARVGVQLDGISRSNEQSAGARRQALLEGFCALASDGLGQPDGAHVVTLLAARGFPRDPAELARLGFGVQPSWGMKYQMHAEPGDLPMAGLDAKRWSGRLLIPWRDEHGRIATIAARTTGDDEPRYLYLQGTTLPAFFRADRFRARTAETVPLVVVEGLIDALLMHSVGIGNVVATGGASISERHVEWIVASGFGKVVLAFDADGAGAPVVRSRRTPLEKAPWRSLPGLEGRVEAQFLRPLYLGESIAPFRLLEVPLALIPWDDDAGKLLDRDAARDAARLNLSRWLSEVEELWKQHGKRSDQLLVPRLDFFGQLSAQMPPAPIRVIYGASGTLPAAAILRDQRAIVEHKLYWTATGEDEAHYLEAILNSETARAAAAHLQSRGQWGARDFDNVMLELPIPDFAGGDALHADLVATARRAEEVAASVDLPPVVNFIRARGLVRAALERDGVGPAIESMVARLLRLD